MPRKARTDRTDIKKADEFLDALREGLSISGASAKSKLPRRTAYDWRNADEEFAKQWDEAVEAGTDALEDEAKRRAQFGVSKPVFHKGHICGHIQEFSDTLLMFTLKARRPEKFRENMKLEVSGTIDLAERVKRAKERGGNA